MSVYLGGSHALRWPCARQLNSCRTTYRAMLDAALNRCKPLGAPPYLAHACMPLDTAPQLPAFLEGRRNTLSDLVSQLATVLPEEAGNDISQLRAKIVDLAARKAYSVKDGGHHTCRCASVFAFASAFCP